MTEPFHRNMLRASEPVLAQDDSGEFKPVPLDAKDPLPYPELNARVHRAMEAAHQIDYNMLHSENFRNWNPRSATERIRLARRDAIAAWNKEKAGK